MNDQRLDGNGDALSINGQRSASTGRSTSTGTDDSEARLVKTPARAATIARGGSCRACFNMIVGNPLNVMLLFVPFGIVAPLVGWHDEVIFTLNFFAILPLAGILGQATEELAGSVGETVGGLLNATFGNAVEMILSVFALKKGLVDVVKGSLLGSILSNLLLVLGMSFAFGGTQYHEQRFNADGARMMTSILLLSVLAMVMPTLAALTPGENSTDPVISRGAAIILAMIYGLYLFFQLITHRESFQSDQGEEEEEEVTMSPCCAVTVLLVDTLLVSQCSEGLVGSVEGMTEKLPISKSFIGVILLPIVGNAAEHATAVTVAMKDKLDLSLAVALGSSVQIALLVVPFTVLTGWAMGVPMDLNFKPVSAGILLITVLIVGNLTADGKSNWLEGIMLVAAYLLVGITFWCL